MIYKYLIALLVTASLPLIPPLPIGIFAWCAASAISLIYIKFLMDYSGIKRPWIVASIEAASMVFCLTAFLQHYLSLKSQFFYVNYEHIMSYCFLIEIGVIITGMANSDDFRRILFVCIDYVTSDKRTYSNIFHRERVLCTTTQKISRMH